MRSAIIIIGVTIVLMACQKKSLPVISERMTEPTIPLSETVNTISNPEAGRIVFANRCSRCHGLPETNLYTTTRWGTILELMAPRARLSKNEKQDVMAYVTAHAKK